jgi:16S rRNA (guanine966-N2)-methyltransferase
MRIVGGSRRTRRLVAPEGRSLRPTSERAREALFNILGHKDFSPIPIRGSRVIDLFAGTGALGLEALSRGAGHLTAVESDSAALGALRQNVKSLDFSDKVRVIHGDATSLPLAPEPCAYAFLDPPYRGGKAAPALASLVEKNWLADGAIVVAETSAKEVLEAPENFEEIERRRYGAAEILIMRYLG